MRIFYVLFLAAIFSLGCARMQVGGTKEPIKLDITMRLDVYQHVENDIDAIENIVSGAQDNKKAADKQSFLGFSVNYAYAAEGLSPEVEQAALRRKDRLSELSAWEEKGAIGENKLGLAELRKSEGIDPAVNELVSAENKDRMIIYQEVAKKNGTSVEEVEKLYAKRLLANAPAGTPIEVLNAASGNYEWKVK